MLMRPCAKIMSERYETTSLLPRRQRGHHGGGTVTKLAISGALIRRERLNILEMDRRVIQEVVEVGAGPPSETLR